MLRAQIYWSIAVVTSAILLVAGLSHASAAGKRVALVIGNGAYRNTAPLQNPTNDAADLAAQLTALGFEVIHAQDLDKAHMDAQIAEFAEALSGADVGVFYYSGHGLQYGGQNYLVPVDARLMTARSLDFEMVRLDLVQRAMERDAKTNIIFLDACRNNPLARNLARAVGTRSAGIPHGLAPVESGIGTLVSFSTQPGNVALDGAGRNSPFAAALVKHIGDDEPITDVLISVRNDVVAVTNQQQVPWEHSALRSRFYFKRPSARRLASSHMPGADASFEQRAELALWRSIKHSKNVAVLQSFLNQFPNGRFANTVRIMIQLLKDEHRQAALAEQRKFDAEMANQQKQAALAQESKAKHKAEIARKGTEYQAALADVRKAREAARDAERRQVEAEQAAEKARRGAQASGAALQQKSTEAPSPPVSVAALPDGAVSGNSADRSLIPAQQTLISDIQKQLKRVGCYTASVDGAWSDTSKVALRQFAKQTGIELSTEGPTQEVLNLLRASKAEICDQTASRENGSSGKRAKSAQQTDQPTSGRLNFGVGGIGF